MRTASMPSTLDELLLPSPLRLIKAEFFSRSAVDGVSGAVQASAAAPGTVHSAAALSNRMRLIGVINSPCMAVMDSANSDCSV